MLTLAASLEAHQLRTHRRPVVEATVYRSHFGVPILSFDFGNPGLEADCPVDAAVIQSGGNSYVLRVRNDSGDLDYSLNGAAWTNLDAVTSGQGFALAVDPNAGVFVLAYGDGNDLKVRTCDTAGSWSGSTTVVTEASPIGSVALAFRSNGNGAAFYTLGTSTTLKRLRRTSGSWAASGTTWSRSGDVASLTGLSAVHSGSDYYLAVTGTEVTTTNERLWAVAMGDGGLPSNAFSGLVPIAEADAAAALSFAYPHLGYVGGDLFLAFQQTEAGDVAYSRLFLTHTTAQGDPLAFWREPFPTPDFSTTHGAAIVTFTSGGNPIVVSLIASNDETSASDFTTGDADDLDSIVAVSWRETPESFKARVTVTVNQNIVGWDPRPGMDLEIRHGFRSGTDGAAEYGVTVRAIVSSVRRHIEAGKLTLTIEADGPWEALARYRAPAAWTAPSGTTRGEIFQRIAGRAGFDVSAAAGDMAPSSAWSTDEPAFAIVAGETGKQTLTRLLAPTADSLRLSSSGGLEICNARGFADTPPVFAFPQNPDLDELTAISADLIQTHHPSWLRLQAVDRYADAFGVSYSSRQPVETNFALLRDNTPADDTAAQDAAIAALQRQLMADVSAEAVTVAHLGLELFDKAELSLAPLDSHEVGYVVGRGIDYKAGPGGPPSFNSVLTLSPTDI